MSIKQKLSFFNHDKISKIRHPPCAILQHWGGLICLGLDTFSRSWRASADTLSGAAVSTSGLLLRTAMQDKLHQNYRKKLIADYEAIENLVRTTGAAFCLSGAGPTLLCITQDKNLQEKLAKKLGSITTANWEMLPLHVEFQGAHILSAE